MFAKDPGFLRCSNCAVVFRWSELPPLGLSRPMSASPDFTELLLWLEGGEWVGIDMILLARSRRLWTHVACYRGTP